MYNALCEFIIVRVEVVGWGASDFWFTPSKEKTKK